jgi:poly(A) polymerase
MLSSILSLVPQGLYGNMLGYLGGFSLSVLVARCCIDNPEEMSTAQMVKKFFEMFAKWDWPQPVST